MILWDIYNLEKLSSDKEKFHVFLTEFIKSHSLDETLDLIRISGVSFNIYSQIQEKYFKEIIILVESHYTETEDRKEVQKFIDEVNSLRTIFLDFFELRASKNLDDISKKRKISSFIISLEIMLGSIYSYIKGNSLYTIKKVYPFVFSLFDEKNNKIIKADKDLNRVLTIADSISENAGSILKFLGGTIGSLGKLDTIKMHEVRIAREHIELYDKWSTLLNLEQKWKFARGNINKKDNKIFIDYKNEHFLKAQKISKVRFNNQKMKWFADFNMSEKTDLKKNINPNATALPPEQFLCEDEAFFSIAIGEFLLIHNQNVSCLNVSLSEWLRAYMVIQLEAKKIIHDRFKEKKVNPLILQKWTLFRTNQDWIDIFVSRGISLESAQIIINTLLFTKDSKDLLDCPFIIHNEHLVVIPSVAAFIDPSMSLISLLTKNNVDISFKGEGLESVIIRNLREIGINAKKIKHVKNGETFECDTVFTIDQDLFFIELKAFGQPLSIKEYYNLLTKIQGPKYKISNNVNERSAIEQLDRIVNFYQNNLFLINKELSLPLGWKPKNIYKIVITTAMLGQTMYIDGCYTIDSSVFIRFLDRIPPGIAIGNVFLKPKHVDFEGDITSEKLLNILTAPPQIELGNLRVIKDLTSIKLNSIEVEYSIFNNSLGDFLKFDKQTLEKLGINIKEIEKLQHV